MTAALMKASVCDSHDVRSISNQTQICGTSEQLRPNPHIVSSVDIQPFSLVTSAQCASKHAVAVDTLRLSLSIRPLHMTAGKQLRKRL